MPAFLVRPEDVDGELLVLRAAEAHHIRVRRYRVGEEIDVIDGAGHTYRVRIGSVARDEVCGHILSCSGARGESPVQLSLAPALIKGQRFDFAVEKATEVGVVRIAPLLTERGVVRPESGNKTARWRRLIEAAAKQCGRSRLPALDEPMTLEAGIEALKAETDALLMASPEGGDVDLHAFMQEERPTRPGLLVGPEGGFSPAERELAHNAGVCVFSWGNRILRADTASVVLAALVLHEAQEAMTHQ